MLKLVFKRRDIDIILKQREPGKDIQMFGTNEAVSFIEELQIF